ncbi:ATP-grasp domain-containing protein [Faecalicatena contorta]|uniref:ATP-grasp domain-containing protein n=1 Tax=Faecalicatena contorta TaxID=39482 RepID=UPI00129DD157|nr:ATP-grasp domain-containing protein [Faecalicatena contorta]MRM91349.1 ATP-grasp domain-containing protein [Faecalicatena contorta]
MITNNRIVIIGANEFQNQLIVKAKEMGLETHVFAWKCGDVGEKTADFFYPISITEKEKILKVCKKIKPIAVTSIASDLAVVTINFVAEKLGLVCNGIKTTKYTTNKFEMRKRLAESSLPVPQFACVNKTWSCEEIGDLEYPLIVKPTDRSGSRGVTKVFSKNDLNNAINYAYKYSFGGQVIIEEFISGEEYSCETISYNGEHKLLAITKKYTTGAPHFIETGHLEPAQIDDHLFEKIESLLEKALDALSITSGASHSEIKIDEDGNIGIIEIGARMGGDCIGSDLVYLSSGYDFLKMTIQTACGKQPDLERKHAPRYAGIRFLLNKNDLAQLRKIEKENPELIYRTWIDSEDERIVEDSSTRLGYFIISGNEINAIKYLFE